MRLDQLLNIHGKISWGLEAPHSFEINKLSFDSRDVDPDTLFFAIKGVGQDGHNFLVDVVKKGVKALVLEDKSQLPSNFNGTYILVLNSRWAMHDIAQTFYSKVSENLISVAVTGTNGKTSTTYILEKIFNFFNFPCGVIGTINHHFKDKIWQTGLTTPNDLQLQERLKEFYSLGARAFAIEASSHALHQERLLQKFDVGIFTNLTRDHLDYHKTMEDYFQAKQILFQKLLKDKSDSFAIINIDDPYGKKMSIPDHVVKLTYGKENSDFQIKEIEQSIKGLKIKLLNQNDILNIETGLVGEHNAYNITAAFAAACSQGVPPGVVVNSLKDFAEIPGRMERVKNSQGTYCFVDYSHTPDSLEKALTSLQKIKPKNSKIFCIFGCGGDRDQGKRPIMASVAENLSDYVVVTSDNPRSEDPQKIIEEIATGFNDKKKHSFEIDRKKAIQMTLEKAGPEDILLVAGKGHESYQIIGDKTFPFSDQEVIREY